MERQPQKTPLPCFGLEHDAHDPQCQACPHAQDCVVYMGSRANKVTLDRLKFDIVPEKFRKDALDMDDPELPHLQRLYVDCHLSVFQKSPLDSDNVSHIRIREAVAKNANKSQCSVRMFMLANMVAHKIHNQHVIEHTEKLRASPFRAKLLTGELSIKRARTYQEMCRDQFGTFSLTSLAVLTDGDDKDDLAATMLSSEITAAKWVVRYKIFNGGPPEISLYESEEIQLAPEWLAIEQSYIDLILKPYIEHKTKCTPTQEQHRFNVFRVHSYYKRHIPSQRLAWLTRQSILPATVKQVLSIFRHTPDDFLFPRTPPVTDPMQFWKSLALTIRHYHCWLYLNGSPSYFTPRRNETLVRHS